MLARRILTEVLRGARMSPGVRMSPGGRTQPGERIPPGGPTSLRPRGSAPHAPWLDAGPPHRAVPFAARSLAAMSLVVMPLLAVVTVAGPAVAHGAPDSPISRTMACAPEGEYVDSAACQAALAASDRQSFEDWDYVRVAGVDGRDREVIPDGEICSGGVAGFAGLDLARADWPSTEVRPGTEFTFTYRTTIPHQGGFRLYVTRDGYDPAEPLAWSDLEEEPFLDVADPELAGDAYQLPGRLPEDKTGHHVILTIWQNTDTPDTYYACSDVVFEAPPQPSPPASSPPASSPQASSPPAAGQAEPVGLAEPAEDSVAVPAAVAASLGVAAAAAAIAIVLIRRQRSRGPRQTR